MIRATLRAIRLGSYQKKVRSTKRNRVFSKKLGFFALNLNMSVSVYGGNSECFNVSSMLNTSNRTTKNQSMVCDICGKSGARQRYISRSYGEGESLLVIEGVPVISCPHCGESYLQRIHCMKLSALNANEKGLRLNAL